jgi:anti-sigma factor RsiW
MEHSEARELLELAAVEPDGFDRLAAGDTAEAAAVAGHLAGCPECSAELERLRRSSAVIREVVSTMAPPELRERTLSLVAAVGRDRSVGATGGPVRVVGAPATRSTEPVSIDAARTRRAGGVGRLGVWVAAIAAVLVVGVVATQLLVIGPRDERIAAQNEDVNALAKAAAWSLSIQGASDAQRVALASTTGDDAMTGTIVYSPKTTHLVVLAQGLEKPPAGMEYRCWVESGGVRTPIGQMFFAGDVAYWVGEAPAIETVGGEVTFGVSLSPTGEPTNVSADPVLTSQAG